MHSFQSINEQFGTMAKLYPARTAIKIEDEEISYAALEQRVNSLAAYLLSLDIPLQSNIVIYMDRSVDCIAATLAVIGIGCVYVPIDPVHAATRAAFILENATPALVITTTQLLEEMAALGAVCRVLDIDTAIIPVTSTAPQISIHGSYAMYILYTSGTTGQPKGVMVHHQGVHNLLSSVKRRWPLNEVVLQFASLGFDASVPEWAGCLTMGGTLLMIKNRKLVLGNELLDLVEKEQVTFMKMPSAVLSMLNHARALPHLKTIVTAGDACTVELVNKWSGARDFYNCYGPTETSIGATIAKCVPEQEKITIGIPHPNLDIYFLTEDMEPVADGEAGEIYIGGIGVSYGYIGNPALTAERFLPDPFAGDGSRIYKTGDFGRLLPGGEIEFIGRVDSQVKIRGYRVELEEVEAHLKTMPAVLDAACIVSNKGELHDNSLLAFLTIKELVTPEAVRAYLRNRIPEYMVPNEVFVMDQFTLTVNGKVDRKALVEYYEDYHRQQELLNNTENSSVDEVAAAVWRTVLKINAIEADSNFFDLGGTSIDAANLIISLEVELGVAPSIADLYEYPQFKEFTDLTKRFVAAMG